MRIAVFHNLPPGGAKRVVEAEIKYLSAKNRVRVFVPSFKLESHLPGFLARLEKDFQNFVLLPIYHRNLARKINRGKFDVVLVHPDKYSQAPFILQYLGIPSIYYCEELLRLGYEKELAFNDQVSPLKRIYENTTRKIRKIIDKENARKATKILTNSKHIQKKIKQAYHRDSLVCYPGVDTQIFKPSGKKGKTVLFIGNKDFMNGYDLIKNVPNLRIVGFQASKPRLTDNELAQEYSGSMATLCVGLNEPFGLTALESMACGTPVLALNEGGYQETVVDKRTGFLLKRDPEAFMRKIDYLVSNPSVAGKMGVQSRLHVRKNFSWEQHGRFLENELRSLVKK